MIQRSRANLHRPSVPRFGAIALASLLVLLVAPLQPAVSQEPMAQTGSIGGTVTDERGAPIGGAQVQIEETNIGTISRPNGEYVIAQVPVGQQSVRVTIIGFRGEAASVTVVAGDRVTHDFALAGDALELQEIVVTGTQTPRVNREASVAITTLTPAEVQQSVPRSTTEMLRNVPGFTRVESSGGEVNQNISMRGILGVEFVMFMEDGLPVFPTMHSFFMNADNLFRFDENVDRMEVVRGGSSALFGSNTPGAIVNFINKTGRDEFSGTARATGGSQGLARFDLNVNGPLGDDWRFNFGGFYRYDHGVRDPGFPGIRGGQVRGSITRLLDNGYVRLSGKIIDDRNQLILPLPFTNAKDPEYVPGVSDYVSMNTKEGLGLRIPTPTGDLELPLDNGMRTDGKWFTADMAFDLADGWRLQNTAQVMQNNQQWNALLPLNVFSAEDYVTTPIRDGGLGFPAGTTFQYFFTNHADSVGNPVPFDTPNDLVAPAGEWHVNKPISAIQDQLQLRRSFGRHSIAIGAYLANYTQDNNWYFTDILTDVRDNPRFLDLVVTPPGGSPINVTKNGFRSYMSDYANGSGQATVVSGVLGAEIQLTEQLRTDVGVRVEYNDFVQASENKAEFDLDGDPDTPFDNVQFGNNSFRHFERDITDWAASLGLNYTLNPELSLYAAASRGYKMPSLDEFLNAEAQEQVDLFDSREVLSIEGGVKRSAGRLGFTLGGFYTHLKNAVSQGAVVDTLTGATTWIIVPLAENRSYGAEIELMATPVEGLQLSGAATILRAELGTGAGADIGSRINGVPTSIANAAAIYTSNSGFQLKADWHWVDERVSLPSYNYTNLGVGYTLRQGTTINIDLLNAFQGKGLEEGNARALVETPAEVFLARPILPRRLTASIKYDFGGPRQQ